MMNQMNHPILICREVIPLPVTQNRMTEIIAIEVAAERDQPALAEVHWDTQMTEVMEEMVVMIIHTILIKAMTRADTLIITGIKDTQYQQQYICGTIPLG